ncbi:MAG: protein-L-isoaspartate(D-aspartate) O-methyltransferase [Nanoarchaeota archaeon]
MVAEKDALVEFWMENFRFQPQVISAFRRVHRERFIPQDLAERAYQDVPLPLLRGKTISQPTTVMIMTSALELAPGQTVFEVGTGSAYQAAIIARIVGPGKVFTTEIIPELIPIARANLASDGIANVEVIEGDGSQGLSDKSPFDRVIITAACKEFPKALIDQLKVGGIIVGPVGTADEQEMVKGVKQKTGGLQLQMLGSFLFTPMYGKYGFEV